MGEAERSIAIKRKGFSSKSEAREESPSEVYTPKRRKSSGQESSPPPYIPSRKESSGTSRAPAVAVEDAHRGDSKTDARQLLSSKARKDLISRSRRMELFRKIGIRREEEEIDSHSSSRQRERRDSERTGNRDKEHVHVSTREVSQSLKVGDVRDLKIMARLGPVRARETKTTVESTKEGKSRGLDLRSKSTRAAYSKDSTLQIIINPTASPALKGSVASRLGKVIQQRSLSSDHRDRDEDEEGERAKTCYKKDDLAIKKTVVNSEASVRKALSSQAKSLVNKQCQEAVISVRSTEQGRRFTRSGSPDSRVVETNDEDDDDTKEGKEGVERSNSLSPSPARSVEDEEDQGAPPVTLKRTDSSSDKSEKETEDLAEMIGEALEPELLKDMAADELKLDLEEENEDIDDLETMIGVKSEEDKPKLGTRFIVTLEGVDERQFEGEAKSGNSSTSLFVKPTIQNVPKLPASAHYLPPPALPAQPASVLPIPANLVQVPPSLPVYNTGHVLPPPPNPLGATLPRGPIKPLPPKIQPFSINLKDSDDEVEDKESRLHSSASGFITPTTLEAMTALQKAKMTERCKFWPACAAGSECEFHHPTSYCKTFPNCKFGDKCLFIHPNCKFDSKCTRPDCPFTHISRRSGLGTSSGVIPFVAPAPPTPSVASTTMCRFIPNCQNPSCPFLHPKPCRFGASCQNAVCPFYHPPVVASKGQLKWKAPPQMEVTASLKLPAPDPASKFRQPVAKVSPMSASNSNTSLI